MKNTQIRNVKKIECQKDDEASKQKRAQRFIKNSAADSLTETIILSAYFCHNYIITIEHGESAQGARKSSKSTVFALYTCIIDNKPPNINTTRPHRTYIAYFKP